MNNSRASELHINISVSIPFKAATSNTKSRCISTPLPILVNKPQPNTCVICLAQHCPFDSVSLCVQVFNNYSIPTSRPNLTLAYFPKPQEGIQNILEQVAILAGWSVWGIRIAGLPRQVCILLPYRPLLLFLRSAVVCKERMLMRLRESRQ